MLQNDVLPLAYLLNFLIRISPTNFYSVLYCNLEVNNAFNSNKKGSIYLFLIYMTRYRFKEIEKTSWDKFFNFTVIEGIMSFYF